MMEAEKVSETLSACPELTRLSVREDIIYLVVLIVIYIFFVTCKPTPDTSDGFYSVCAFFHGTLVEC
jgi:hypothetical protein